MSKTTKTAATKTTKTTKNGKPSAQPAQLAAAQANVSRDPWGARIGSATKPLNDAIAKLADSEQGAGVNAIFALAHKLAEAAKIELRGAVGTHLNALRLAGMVEPVARGVWRVTKLGSQRWKSNAAGAKMSALVAEQSQRLAEAAAKSAKRGKK